MSSGAIGPGQGPSEEEPDAVARGSVQYTGGPRESALFVLAGESLGVGRTEHPDPPVWIELQAVKGLDALGDTVDGVLEVEMTLDDGRVLQASWPEAFCDRVVETLVGLAGGGTPTPPPAPAPAPAPGPAPGPASTVPVEQFPPPEVVASSEVPAGLESMRSPFGAEPTPLPGAAPGSHPDPAVAPPGAAVPPPFAPEGTVPSLADPGSLPAPAPGPPADAPVVTPFGDVATPTDSGAFEPPAAAAPPTAAPATDMFAPSAAAAPGVPATPDAPAPAGPAPAEAAPAAGAAVAATAGAGVGSPPAGSTALVLEDVVYLGGYPGQTKKRKKCTATLTREGLEVTGPGGLGFRVSWDVVRTVETQNADEARFRMNTKVHRDATALVVECQQDVTILLEARDCPTIPLRTAIAQLVSDLRVVVV